MFSTQNKQSVLSVFHLVLEMGNQQTKRTYEELEHDLQEAYQYSRILENTISEIRDETISIFKTTIIITVIGFICIWYFTISRLRGKNQDLNTRIGCQTSKLTQQEDQLRYLTNAFKGREQMNDGLKNELCLKNEEIKRHVEEIKALKSTLGKYSKNIEIYMATITRQSLKINEQATALSQQAAASNPLEAGEPKEGLKTEVVDYKTVVEQINQQRESKNAQIKNSKPMVKKFKDKKELNDNKNEAKMKSKRNRIRRRKGAEVKVREVKSSINDEVDIHAIETGDQVR